MLYFDCPLMWLIHSLSSLLITGTISRLHIPASVRTHAVADAVLARLSVSRAALRPSARVPRGARAARSVPRRPPSAASRRPRAQTAPEDSRWLRRDGARLPDLHGTERDREPLSVLVGSGVSPVSESPMRTLSLHSTTSWWKTSSCLSYTHTHTRTCLSSVCSDFRNSAAFVGVNRCAFVAAYLHCLHIA